MSGGLVAAARRVVRGGGAARAVRMARSRAAPVRGLHTTTNTPYNYTATPVSWACGPRTGWHALVATQTLHSTRAWARKRGAPLQEVIEPEAAEAGEFDPRFQPSAAEDVDGLMEEVLRRYSPEKHDAADFDRIVDEVAMEFLQSSHGQAVGNELEREWDAFQQDIDGATGGAAASASESEGSGDEGDALLAAGSDGSDAEFEDMRGELDEPDEAMLHEDEVLDAFRSLSEDELAKLVADVVAGYTPTGNEAADDAAVSRLVDEAIDTRVMELLVRREELAAESTMAAEEEQEAENMRLGHKESRTLGRNARAGKKKRKKLHAQREEDKRAQLEAEAAARQHDNARAARMRAEESDDPFATDSEAEEVDVSAWDAAEGAEAAVDDAAGDEDETEAYAAALREQMAMLQAELEAVEAKKTPEEKKKQKKAAASKGGDEDGGHDSFSVDVDAEGRVVVQNRRTHTPVEDALWDKTEDAWAMGEGDGRRAPRKPRKSELRRRAAAEKAKEAAGEHTHTDTDIDTDRDTDTYTTDTEGSDGDGAVDEVEEYGAVLRSARGSGAGGAAARGRGRGERDRDRSGPRVVPLKQAARVEERLQRILARSMNSADLAYENVSVQEVEMSNDLRRAVVWWTLHSEAFEDEPAVVRELFERDLVRKRRVIRKKLADSMRSSRVVPVLTFRYDDRASEFDAIEREMMELGIPFNAEDDPNPTSA